MSVSVVIPTTLRRPAIEETLRSVLASTTHQPDSEVLLIVNGSPAGRRPLHIHSPRLRILETTASSAAEARNVGLEIAQNELVLFTDDDCIVPEEWCSILTDALQASNAAAAAAPVRIAVSGPITAFIDYQRIFDAPPMNEHEVRYLITCNCGIHRGRIPPDVMFDEQFVTGGEDADFGYAIRDRGGKIRWLAAATPVTHMLTESIDEITSRFVGYGRASVRLAFRKGRWQESVPGALGWYRVISEGIYEDYRSFLEIGSDLRDRFVHYELMMTSAFLIGYLEELGIQAGHRLIDVDHDGLNAGWHRIATKLNAKGLISLDGNYSLSFFDSSRWAASSAARDENRFPSDIADVLREYAKTTKLQQNHGVDDLLSRNSRAFSEAQQRDSTLLAHLWRSRLSRSSVSVGELDEIVRSVGVSFRDGCHELEKVGIV